MWMLSQTIARIVALLSLKALSITSSQYHMPGLNHMPGLEGLDEESPNAT